MSLRLGASALAGVGIVVCGSAGCGLAAKRQLENYLEDTTLRGPLHARVSLTGVDAATVRAGLFADPSPADELDGDAEDDEVGLSNDGSGDAAVDVELPYGATHVGVAPLVPAAIEGDRVVFTLPELDGETDLVPVVWIDGDGDDLLDADEHGHEAARSLYKDSEGQRSYLYGYGYDPDGNGYTAYVVRPGDGAFSPVEDDQRDGWQVTLDRATDPI